MTTSEQDKVFGAAFLDGIIEWIAANLDPEDVFDCDELSNWALDNGFEEQQSRL